MSLGNKLAKLRKEHNYTQEQLADILQVSRQAVSKWESDMTYPETEKLLKLGALYQCSMDYLLKDEANETKVNHITISLDPLNFEKKSKRTVFGLPLWHINIGYGKVAKGIFAIGLVSKGVFSMGLVSCGFVSLGILSIGAFSLGVIALALLALGAISIGVIACGAISIGILSVGALSIGYFSIGAKAIGKYLAIGDHAEAMIAVGRTYAIGSIYQYQGENYLQLQETILPLLDQYVPIYFSWVKSILQFFL